LIAKELLTAKIAKKIREAGKGDHGPPQPSFLRVLCAILATFVVKGFLPRSGISESDKLS
jgi:hypothetical protein